MCASTAPCVLCIKAFQTHATPSQCSSAPAVSTQAVLRESFPSAPAVAQHGLTPSDNAGQNPTGRSQHSRNFLRCSRLFAKSEFMRDGLPIIAASQGKLREMKRKLHITDCQSNWFNRSLLFLWSRSVLANSEPRLRRCSRYNLPKPLNFKAMIAATNWTGFSCRSGRYFFDG